MRRCQASAAAGAVFFVNISIISPAGNVRLYFSRKTANSAAGAVFFVNINIISPAGQVRLYFSSKTANSTAEAVFYCKYMISELVRPHPPYFVGENANIAKLFENLCILRPTAPIWLTFPTEIVDFLNLIENRNVPCPICAGISVRTMRVHRR